MPPIVIGLGNSADAPDWKDPLGLYSGGGLKPTPSATQAQQPAQSTTRQPEQTPARVVTKNSSFDQRDWNDIVDTVIAEAGGEGPEGMSGVAAVIKNRAANRGISPGEVIRQPSQFEGYENPREGSRKAQRDPAMRAQAEEIIRGVFDGTLPDPTGGADHFHADYVNPDWARKLPMTKKIGGHSYYASKGRQQTPAAAAIEGILVDDNYVPKDPLGLMSQPAAEKQESDLTVPNPDAKGLARLVRAEEPDMTAATAFLETRLRGHSAEHITGMVPELRTGLAALFQSAPPEIAEGLEVFSGARSVARQKKLFADAVEKYGSVAAARKWVAPPPGEYGSKGSKHNLGQAGDLQWNGKRLDQAPAHVRAWVHENAPKHGLAFPLGHEPWHIETADARGGKRSPAAVAVAEQGAVDTGAQPVGTAGSKGIVVDENYKPADGMNIYGGASPFGDVVQANAAQQEQTPPEAVQPTTDDQAIDQTLEQLNAEAPGKFAAMTEDEYAVWKENWDKENLSTGRGGDLARKMEAGNADLGRTVRTVVGMIPKVGPSIVSGLDAVDEWITGKPTEQRLKDYAEKSRATVTDAGKVSYNKTWWDSDRGTLGPAWTDPDSYLGAIAESAPATLATMGPSALLARGAYAGAIAAGVGERAAAATAARTALISGAVGEGALGGGQSVDAVRERIAEIPPEQLLQTDSAKALLSQGLTADEAIAAITDDASVKAFIVAGVSTGAFGGLGDRALAKIIAEGVGGGVAKRLLAGTVRGAVGEGLLEELPQSVAQTASENLAVRDADPNQSLTEGLAESAASGLATGAAMGGGLGAAGGAVSPTGSVQDATEQVVAPVDQTTGADTTEQAPPAGAGRAGPLTTAVQHGEKQAARQQSTGIGAQVAAAAAASSGTRPDAGSTVEVTADGIEPFMATIESYDGDEAVVVDNGSGEVYQIPVSSLKVLALPPGKGAPLLPERDVLPETSDDEALRPVDPVAGEIKSEMPPRSEQTPAMERLPSAPAEGQRVIVDTKELGRFAARVVSYEEGATEILVTDDSGKSYQVPSDRLFVSKLTPAQVEQQELKRNPPVERETPELTGSDRRIGDKTVSLPDQLHSRLYDLGKERLTSKRLMGTSALGMDEALPAEQRKLAAEFKVDPQALGQMADDYRYRVERAAKEAKSKLPVKMHAVNEKRLKDWQAEHRRAGTIEDAPVPPDEGKTWWDALSQTERRIILDDAGIKRSEKVDWAGHTPGVRAKLNASRSAGDIGPTAPVADEAVAGEAPAKTNVVDPVSARREVDRDAKYKADNEQNYDDPVARLRREFGELPGLETYKKIVTGTVGALNDPSDVTFAPARKRKMSARTIAIKLARRAGKSVGAVTFNLNGAKATDGGVLAEVNDEPIVVSHIHVNPTEQQSAVARGLIDSLRSEYPGRRIELVGEPGKSIELYLSERFPDKSATQGKEENPAAPMDAAAHEAATSPRNDLPEPTQAQKEAGNYKVGRLKLAGLDISIENPAGSSRSGTDKSGKAWSVEMKSHYGYIRRTEGADGDHVDVFVNPGPDQDIDDDSSVYVVDQIDPASGKLDEHKIMIGYESERDAQDGYLENYAKGWKGLGKITGTTLGEFKTWLKDGDTTKAFAQDLSPKEAVAAENASAESVASASVSRNEVFSEEDAAKARAVLKEKLAPAKEAEPASVKGDRISGDEVRDLFRSKEFKTAYADIASTQMGTPHPESAVAHEIARGWFDQRNGRPPKHQAAPRGTSDPIEPYYMGYAAARDGKARVIRASDQEEAYRELAAGWAKEKAAEAETDVGTAEQPAAYTKPEVPAAVYHGTSDGGFSSFDTYRGKYGLFGSGGYFTEDPAIALEYTRKGKGAAPTVYQARINVKNALDMDAVADKEAWEKAFPEYFDARAVPASATNEQAYREVEESLSAEMIPDYEGAETMQDGVRSMGYDAITHVGGGRHKASKGVKHRVWIVFEPEQVDDFRAMKLGDDNEYSLASGGEGAVAPAPVAKLTGKELIDFGSGADMPALRAAARRWYDENLRGTTVSAADGSVVSFNQRGRNKTVSGGKGDRLLRSVPAIRDIIENGREVLREPGNRPEIVERIVLAAPIELDGEVQNLAVSIHRTASGDLHYDFTFDREAGGPGIGAQLADGDFTIDSDESAASILNLFPWRDEIKAAPDGWGTADTDTDTGLGSPEDIKAVNDIIREVAGLNEVMWMKRIDLPNGAPAWGTTTPTTAGGFYSPGQDVIAIAENTASATNAYHEAFHRLQHLFLSNSEKAVLKAEIGRLRRMVQQRIGREKQAAKMTAHEVEAEAFAAYATGSSIKPHTALRAAWDRILKAIRQVQNFMQGRGFQTAEDIFGRAKSGAIAQRAAKSAVKSDPEFSIAPTKPAGATIVTQNRIVSEVASKFTDIQPKLLATIPLNYFSELRTPEMTAIDEYLKVKRSLDTYRSKKHEAAATMIDEWRAFLKTGLLGQDKSRAKQLSDLMHASTLAGIDPSLTDDETKAKPGYDTLRKQYTALPPKGRAIYGKVRDSYKDQADELDRILLDNIRKSQQIALDRAEKEHNAKLEELNRDGKLSAAERKAEERKLNEAYTAQRTRAQWSMKARMTKMRIAFESNRVPAPYFPLARFGRYFVSVKGVDGEVLNFSKQESASEQKAFAADMRRMFPGANIKTGVVKEGSPMRDAMDPRMLAEIDEILGTTGVDASIMDMIYQRYLDTLPDLSMRKRFIHRKGVAGFHTDAMRVYASHLFHAAHQIGRLKYGLELQELVNNAIDQAGTATDQVRSMTLANEFAKRHKWTMNPTGSAAAQWATSTAFVWFIGMSPASAILNITQTVMMGVPILGAKYGGVAKAGAALLRAGKDFVAGRGAVANAKLKDDEIRAMKAFYESGLIDRTRAHDLAGVGETGVEYSPGRAKVMGVIGWAFHQAEVVNREVTALAGYRLARAAGRTEAQAIEETHEQVTKIHFDYSNSSRPRIMQNDAAKVALVFRAYNINMLYRIFRDVHQSIKGESPQTRKEARFQLAGIVGMMSLMAGVTGTVGFNLAMTIAAFAFGDDDDPMDFEQTFRKDMLDILGPELGGVVLNGVPGHYLGIDLSRIGMPDLWFRSPSRDLQGKEEWNEFILNSLGAVAGMGGQVWQGIDLLLDDGGAARGIEMLAPKWARDAMKSYRYANEGVTSVRGDEILPQGEIDYSDVIAQFLGFTPAKVAETWDRNIALKNAESTVLKKRRALMNRYAMAVSMEDDEAKAEAIRDIRKFNTVPVHRPLAITPKSLRQSLKTRARNASKREDGVLIANPELGRSLRERLPAPVYR